MSSDSIDETADAMPEQSMDRTVTARSNADHRPVQSSKHKPRKLGPYQLTKLLGKGGFGSVWKAFDERLNRHVAIKIPHDRDDSGDRLRRFLDEARTIASLDHPGLLRVFEVGQSSEFPYIVTEFIDGSDLKEFLQGREISIRSASALCAKMAMALEHAHAAGVVHRDLKPANVMMDRDDEPHIMDFGLAKQFTQKDTEKTIDGQIMGTPAYMSPEQAKGDSKHVDRRSDLFSLGVMLYEMLTGERPFRGKSAMLLKQVIEDEATPPRKLNSAIPIDLQSICLKCLEKEPERRYESAAAFAEDLSAFLSDRPVHAKPSTRLQRFNKWCRRNPIVAAISSLAVSFLLALLVLSTTFLIRERRLRVSINDALNEKSQALNDTQRLTVDLNKKQAGLQSAMDLVATGQQIAKKQLITYADSLYAYQISDCQDGLQNGDWLHVREQLAAIETADPDNTRRCWAWDFLNHELNKRCQWLSTNAKIKDLILVDREATDVVGRNIYGQMVRWQQNGDTFEPIATAIPRYDQKIDFDYCTANRCFAVIDLKGHLTIVNPRGGNDGLSDDVRKLVLSTVHFEPEKQRLVAFDQSGNATVIAIDPEAPTAARTWVAESRWSGSGAVLDVCWNPSGNTIAVLHGGKVDIRSMPDGKLIRTIQLRRPINCIAWSTDDQLLAGSGWGASTIAIDTGTATEFAGRTFFARGIVAAPDPDRVFTLSRSGKLQCWSISAKQLVSETKLFTAEGTVLVGSKDGRYLLAGSDGGGIARIDLSMTASLVPKKLGVNSTVRRVDWDRKSSRLAAADWSGYYTVWNTEDGIMEQAVRVAGKARLCESAVWHPLEDRIATSDNHGAIRLWDANRGVEVASAQRHQGSAYGIAWSPDGSRLASGGTDEMVRIWDGRSLEQIEAIDVGDAIEQVTWGPKSKLLFAAGDRLLVRDTESGENLVNETSRANRYFNIVVHSDGKQFATCDAHGVVKVRSLDADMDETTLATCDGAVRGLAWSPDGRCLVSADWRGEISVWNVSAKRRLLTLESPRMGPGSRAWSAAFSTDGNQLAVSNEQGDIFIWASR